MCSDYSNSNAIRNRLCINKINIKYADIKDFQANLYIEKCKISICCVIYLAIRSRAYFLCDYLELTYWVVYRKVDISTLAERFATHLELDKFRSITAHTERKFALVLQPKRKSIYN